MTTQELVGTDVEIINALDFEPELACESLDATCSHPHPAEWLVTYSCGCAPLLCNKGKVKMMDPEKIYSCPRCGADYMIGMNAIPIERKK